MCIETAKRCNAIVFVNALYTLYNITGMEIEEVINAAKSSFRRWYEDAMAENTCKYLDMDMRVFSTTSEETGYLAQEVIETGLVDSEEYIWALSKYLFTKVISSLNSAINWITLNEK